MSPYTFPCAHRLLRTHTHRHKSGAALSCGLPFKGVLSTCYYAITLKGFSHFSSHSRLSLESSFSIATFMGTCTKCQCKGLWAFLATTQGVLTGPCLVLLAYWPLPHSG